MDRRVDRCPPYAYSEPTPAWFHSYGLDYDGALRRGDVLQSRFHQIMRDRLPTLPQLWEIKNAREKITPPPTIARVVMDMEDATHHCGAWPTQKESQSIGWFADPLRLPRCTRRSWPQNYSFV
ncbi:unnamed protein product [Lymnaea stagnalis]|uniref:Uncharacterized protein n=1 Tax=Lymnaea stagnalis TaxID=6523 RepID=A0AAV2H298_LYMST